MQQVVVEDSNVSKDLINGRTLRHRVTFLPLKQTTFQSLNREKIKQIMQVTSNKAHLAIDLIEYDQRMEPAMQSVFGRVFVCDDT